MFDKFGEFESVEELNKAADGLLNEGDTESLMELARENGIPEEDAEDYIEGLIEDLANATTAAYGRLDIEESEVKTEKGEDMIGRVLFNMARPMCADESFCKLVTGKGKRLMKVYSTMREVASKHKRGNVAVACGTDRELQKLIRVYYEQGESELAKEVEKING